MDSSRETQSLPPTTNSPPSWLTPEKEAYILGATQKANELNRLSVPRLQYDNLPFGWIRVIDLQGGSDDDPIICSLSSQPIKCPERYEAISWTWGDPERRCPITCNWRVPIVYENDSAFALPQAITKNFKVTDNLRRLLLHLRQDIPRRLWIDQICINQGDDKEKAVQIRLMAEIYSGASRVVIWLGDEAAAADAGHDLDKVFAAVDLLSLLRGMDSKDRRDFFEWLFTGERPAGCESSIMMQSSPDSQLGRVNEEALRQRFLALDPRTPDDELRRYGYTGIHFLESRHLSHFLEHTRWFRRAWTFQESVMGLEATVVYGNYSRGWDAVCQACETMTSEITFNGPDWAQLPCHTVAESIAKRGLYRQDWARLQAIHDPALRGTPKYDRAMEIMRGSDMVESLKKWRLKVLLPELRPTDATEPVDKVLALTGFAHDDGRLIVFPTGKEEVAQLYLTVAKYWLTTEENTPYILSMGFQHRAAKPQEWDQWPCPLVAANLDLSLLSHVGEVKHMLPSWVPDWACPLEATPLLYAKGFCAAGDWTEPASMVHSSGKQPELRLKGVLVGTVQAVDADPTNFDGHAQMLAAFADPYPTTDMSYLDVYRAVVSPAALDSMPKPTRSRNPFGFWASRTGNNAAGVSAQPAGEANYTAPDLQHVLPSLHQLGAREGLQRSFFTGRVFCSLTSGLLGLAPKMAEPGDHVYVVPGAVVPFVIRRNPEGAFAFVGECYAFGIMHGEILEGLPEERVEDLVLV